MDINLTSSAGGLTTHLEIAINDLATVVMYCSLVGDVDLDTAPHLETSLREALDLWPCHLLVDLSALEFLASVGLQLLLDLHAHQRATAHRLVVVVGGNTTVRRALLATGLDRVLDVYEELSVAKQACSVN